MKKNRLEIGLIIPYYQRMFSTFYTLEIIKEVSKAAIGSDIDLLIDTAWRAPSISGVLFVDIVENEQLINLARRKKIPYIILNYYNKESSDNCIGIDNEKPGCDAVRYLINSGHRRIATITGKLNVQTGIQRLVGFKRGLQEKKIDLDSRYIVAGDWTKASGKRGMKKLLALKRERPSAVFIAGDEMALGAIEAIREAGLKVPKDISLVGFDNIPEASSDIENLSTIEQPFAELAQLGIRYLSQIIKKKTKMPVKVLLGNAKLIKRASVRVLRKRK